MQVAIGAGIVCDKSFNGLNSNFCAAIGMWVCDGGEAMVDSAVLEELACDCGCELWSSVGCAFIRNAKCGEGLL